MVISEGPVQTNAQCNTHGNTETTMIMEMDVVVVVAVHVIALRIDLNRSFAFDHCIWLAAVAHPFSLLLSSLFTGPWLRWWFLFKLLFLQLRLIFLRSNPDNVPTAQSTRRIFYFHSRFFVFDPTWSHSTINHIYNVPLYYLKSIYCFIKNSRHFYSNSHLRIAYCRTKTGPRSDDYRKRKRRKLILILHTMHYY